MHYNQEELIAGMKEKFLKSPWKAAASKHEGSNSRAQECSPKMEDLIGEGPASSSEPAKEWMWVTRILRSERTAEWQQRERAPFTF